MINYENINILFQQLVQLVSRFNDQLYELIIYLMLILRGQLRYSSTISYAFTNTKPRKQKTLYQMLQVPTTATPTTIKKNYLKLAKIYHPDIYKGADRNRFQKIQEAYNILSNQNERIKYDQSIGMRHDYQPEKQEKGQSANTNNGQTYGKPPNDFSYSKPKVQINLDEEYEKFFKKKSTTNFQQIRLHEAAEFKAMSEKERIRRRFTEVYTDPSLDWKMKYSKSYSQILDDQINQKNRYQQQLKKKQQEFQKKYTEQAIKMQKKLIKIGGGMAFLLMLPFIMSFKTKLQLEREAKECYQRKVKEIFEQIQSYDIKKRLQFD